MTEVSLMERIPANIQDRLGAFDGRLDGVQRRLGNVEEDLEEVNGRLGRVERRVELLDERLEVHAASVHAQFRELRAEMAAGQESVRAEMAAGFAAIDTRLDRMTQVLLNNEASRRVLERRADDHGMRIAKIEERRRWNRGRRTKS